MAGSLYEQQIGNKNKGLQAQVREQAPLGAALPYSAILLSELTIGQPTQEKFGTY